MDPATGLSSSLDFGDCFLPNSRRTVSICSWGGRTMLLPHCKEVPMECTIFRYYSLFSFRIWLVNYQGPPKTLRYLRRDRAANHGTSPVQDNQQQMSENQNKAHSIPQQPPRKVPLRAHTRERTLTSQIHPTDHDSEHVRLCNTFNRSFLTFFFYCYLWTFYVPFFAPHSSQDMKLESVSLSCTCRHILLHCGVSYSSSSPFMRSNMSSLPSLACHVCQLAILSTRLSSCTPGAKKSCRSLFAAAKSCNTEFLHFFLGVLPFTAWTISAKVERSAQLMPPYQACTLCIQPLSLKGGPRFFFPHLAEAIEGTLRFTVHIS